MHKTEMKPFTKRIGDGFNHWVNTGSTTNNAAEMAANVVEAIWPEIEKIIEAPAQLLPILKKIEPVIVRKKTEDEPWTCILCNVHGKVLPLEHTVDCPWYTVEKLTVADMDILL